jgi:indole-3-glycerol phosphate synthase
MFLDEIVRHVKEGLAERQQAMPPSALRDRPLFHLPCRAFAESLNGDSRRIIAEVKRASPSQGLIRKDFDPVGIAQDLAAHGASALSVLTEERFFQGSLVYLEQIKKAVSVPLLRKDFVVDRYQILEARSFGADAVLLIAALLDPILLRELKDEARSLSLDALVEVHTEAELERALEADARLIGINNRDLRTFEVRLETTERLRPLIPHGIPVICESGIESLGQVRRLESFGVRIFLVGEVLMRAPNPGAKLRELLS